jgi:hypothetical protein
MRPEDRAREMLAEAGIPEAGSTRLVGSLTALGRTVDEVEPLPGPELRSLLTRPSRPARRRRARLMMATAVALGTVGAGGVAAAANELPDPAQDFVAKFSQRYLPFDVPRAEPPGGTRDTGLAPAPQTPPAVADVDRVGGVPAQGPDDETAAVRGPVGGAPEEIAGPDVSDLSPGSPSLADAVPPPPAPAPTPAQQAPLAGDGAVVDESGGAPGPEPGQEPVSEPQPAETPADEEAQPEASPAPDAGASPDDRTGQQTGKSQDHQQRRPGARGKPSVAPPDGDDP